MNKEICGIQSSEKVTRQSPVNQLFDLKELGIKTRAIEEILLQQCDNPTALRTAIKGSFPQDGTGLPFLTVRTSSVILKLP